MLSQATSKISSNHSHWLCKWETINIFEYPKLLGKECSFEPLCEFVRRNRDFSHGPCFTRWFGSWKHAKCWPILLAIGDQKHGKQSDTFNISILIRKHQTYKQPLEITHWQQVSDILHFFVCLVNLPKFNLGSELFIKNRTTANLRKLDVFQWKQHRHLFSSRHSPPSIFHTNTQQLDKSAELSLPQWS